MRIIKLDIYNSKTNIRPRDFIKTLYPNITTRLSAFSFAFHPRARKVFTQHKRPRKSSEEYCNEEWSRKSKKHCGYLKSNDKVSSLCKKIGAEANEVTNLSLCHLKRDPYYIVKTGDYLIKENNLHLKLEG